LTEFFSRFLFRGLIGKLIDFIFAEKLSEFKLFPFSTNNIYDNVEIIADDGSGIKNISNNGNIWLSCNCPKTEERNVEILLN
jgi:hypothetical protein